MTTKPLWSGGVAPDGWRLLAHLVPASDDVVPQSAGLGASGRWYLSQGRDSGSGSNATDDLILTCFEADGRRVGALTIRRGGHGNFLAMSGELVGVSVGGVWCWLPWRAGTMTVAQAQAYRGPHRRLTALPSRYDCQGEADLGWLWLRLYGGSMKGGSERDWSHHTATLEAIEGTRVLRVFDLDGLARDAKGLPLGGRYEPEGVSVVTIGGEPWVVVGFAVGRLGSTTMNVYGCPLGHLLGSI